MPVSPVFNGGGSSGGVSFNLVKQDVSDQCTGTNNSFTLTQSYQVGSLQVYWNGLLQLDEDITEYDSFTFITSFYPASDDHLVVIYLH